MTIIDVFSLKSKKVIVFDLDGTIVRLAADWPSLLKALNARYSEKYKEKGQFKSISNLLSDIVARGDEEELQHNFSIIQKYELKKITRNEPIKEVIYFINNKELFGVNSAVKLAIFSLNTKATIIKSLQIAGVVDKFEFCVGREDVRAWKPEPEGLLKISDYFQVLNKDMIYFGDLKKDLLAGANAGVESYFIFALKRLVKKVKLN
ncbi:MAG: HAD family hydrolase [Candidatus Lokiarchaeota archaeon]|nr:HAD family hydrolase [Candidatus Lokiarchaeota archaeon]